MNKENKNNEEFKPMTQGEYRFYGGVVMLILIIITVLLQGVK